MLIGGLVAIWALQMAYLVACVFAILMIVLVYRFFEPPVEENETYANPIREVVSCLGYLKQPMLLCILLFFVLMTILNHVPYEFFQPYISCSLESFRWGDRATPVVSGIHVTLTLLVASAFGAWSMRIRDRIGMWWDIAFSSDSPGTHHHRDGLGPGADHPRPASGAFGASGLDGSGHQCRRHGACRAKTSCDLPFDAESGGAVVVRRNAAPSDVRGARE